MLELDFESIQISTVSSVEREIVVHPVGHAERDYDHRAGIVMTWRGGVVGLATSRFFNDSGCYVTAHLGTFPDRPFPADKAQAIGVVKEAIRAFAAGLLGAYPAPAQAPAPCRYCGGAIVDARCGACGEADGV